MRVQHNIMAMNSYRNYNNNSSAINKNIEKLSSGYQINRAGDNAAGLAISEKMRAQITGLEVAQKNAKDGISLVQTAEGALTEVHSMLNRMYELAEQSANGTYNDKVDRAQLQKEVESLKTEIDRIADSANFNGTKLLNGELSANPAAGLSGDNAGGVTLSDQSNISAIDLKNSEATGDVEMAISSNEGSTAGGATLYVKVGDTTYSYSLTSDTGELTSNTVELENSSDPTDKIEITLTDDGKTRVNGAFNADNTNSSQYVMGTFDNDGKLTSGTKIGETGAADGAGSAGDAGSAVDITDKTYVDADGLDMGDSEATGKLQLGIISKDSSTATVTVQVGEKTYTADVTTADGAIELDDGSGEKITLTLNTAGTAKLNEVISASDNSSDVALGEIGEVKAADASLSAGSSNALTLQIGDDSNSWNQMKVSIDDIHVSKLGAYTTATSADKLSYKVTEKSSEDAEAPKTIEDIDISTQKGAAAALDVIKEAINYVSDTRGGLGAIQNRLEHTINNLSVMQENMQDAESTIRDTDVAAEMMKYTKNSILVQSAQAMLAQANQQPQGVLQLLQ